MQNITVAKQTNRLAGIAIFVAIIAVLQTFTTFIRPGLIPITLALPPIIIGAAMYGAKVGALLGATFGTVVFLSGVTGVAPLSAAMFNVSPWLMMAVTLGRGAAIGLAAGLVFALFAKENVYLAVMSAAVAAPIVNTGVFVTVLVLFFNGLLIEREMATSFWGLFTAFVGFNFTIELVVNIILAPAIVRLIAMARKKA
jgi:uncharacterized membrane protein